MVFITVLKEEREESNSRNRPYFVLHNLQRFLNNCQELLLWNYNSVCFFLPWQICITSKILEKESLLSNFVAFLMIRLALDLAHISYVDHTIQLAEWPDIKARGLEEGFLPFGQLPFLKIDGLNLIQSTSILRYLSRKQFSDPLFFCQVHFS